MVDRGKFKDMSRLSFVDDRVRSFAHTNTKQSLPDGWTPNAWSVICGRGKECHNHFGNRRFRILTELNMQKYKDAKSKIEKSSIVTAIVDAVREASVTGGFVKKDPSSQRWHEVPDAIAREKVAQQIRETLVKINPKKCETRKLQRLEKAKRPRLTLSTNRKVQRLDKAKRPRLTLSTSASMMPSSSAVSMSSSATSLSSVREEFNCSGSAGWGNNDAIDTDDTTPLQVDFSTLTSNYNNSISISPPPSLPPLSQKGSDSPIAFVQSGKYLHKNRYVSQPVPDWQNQQELVWNYGWRGLNREADCIVYT